MCSSISAKAAERMARKARLDRPSLIMEICMLLAWIACTWVAVLFLPLAIVAAFLLLWRLSYDRRRPLILWLIVSPCFVMFTTGVAGYCTGHARMQTMGLPGTAFHNVRPDTRLQWSTGGCLVSGGEWVVHAPHNAGIRLMCVMFGPMPGSYTGPYPTQVQAMEALANPAIIDAEELVADRVAISGRTIALDKGVGRGLVSGLDLEWVLLDTNDPQERKEELAALPVRATLFKDECLVLRIPAQFEYPNVKRSARIALIDVQSGRPFAYYAEGDYHHHFPPVWWNRNR